MSKRALVCGLMPEFEHDSGSRVLYDLINMLCDLGYAVTLVTEHSTHEAQYAHILQQRGIPVYLGIDRWIEHLLTRSHYDLAVFALWFMAEPYIPIIRRVSPRTRIVVHSIDLHFVRNARQAYSMRGESGTAGQLDAKYGDEMRRELNTYAVADLVLTVSQKEADFIKSLIGIPDLAHVLPDSAEASLSPYAFAERRGILLIGFFSHLPNIDGAYFLLKEIIPRLDTRLLDEHPLYIVGRGANELLREQVAEVAGVKLVDWVPSLTPYLHRARITVIPLRYGAGTKGKLIQALMAGTPSVSTTIGIEGLQLEHGKQVLVADEAARFAESMVHLLKDEPFWCEIARQGRAHIMQRHSRAVVREMLARALERIERV